MGFLCRYILTILFSPLNLDLRRKPEDSDVQAVKIEQLRQPSEERKTLAAVWRTSILSVCVVFFLVLLVSCHSLPTRSLKHQKRVQIWCLQGHI